MKEIFGSCLCENIKYKFKADELLSYQCHCSICQKSTGSAFSTTLMARKEGFEWLRGKEHVSAFSKSTGYTVSFCKSCGSTVPNEFRGYSLMSVPVGGLDNSESLKVSAQLHLYSKASWETEGYEGSLYDEMPSLDEMFKLLHLE